MKAGQIIRKQNARRDFGELNTYNWMYDTDGNLHMFTDLELNIARNRAAQNPEDKEPFTPESDDGKLIFWLLMAIGILLISLLAQYVWLTA